MYSHICPKATAMSVCCRKSKTHSRINLCGWMKVSKEERLYLRCFSDQYGGRDPEILNNIRQCTNILDKGKGVTIL